MKGTLPAHILLVVLTTGGLLAGQTDYLDVSQIEPRERARPPQLSGGGCGGSSHEPPPKDNLEVELVSLDQSHYLLGEEVVFEVKLKNTGRDVFKLPWNPQVADFENDDPSEAYSYQGISISLKMANEDGDALIYSTSLYGSPSVLGSFLDLRPRDWVLVRARALVYLLQDNDWSRQLVSRPVSNLKVTPVVFRTNFEVRTINGITTEDSRCARLGVISKGERSIEVAPRTVERPDP